MPSIETLFKYKHWWLIAIIFLFLSISKTNAEEIQPFPQLKEFPKLPQLPNIELKRFQEPIKPFNPLTSETDRSKPTTPPPNFDKSLLIGDWKANQPFNAKYFAGSTTIEGILFTVLPDSSLSKEWTSEGVMFASTNKEGARELASSFNYKTLSNLLLLMITFSANDLKNGVVIPFEVMGVAQNSDKARVLKLKNNGINIELIEERRKRTVNTC